MMIAKIILAVVIVLFGGLMMYGILNFHYSKFIISRCTPFMYAEVNKLLLSMERLVAKNTPDRVFVAVDEKSIEDWPEDMKANVMYIPLAEKYKMEGFYISQLTTLLILVAILIANCLGVFNGWIFYLYAAGLVFTALYTLIIFHDDYAIKQSDVPDNSMNASDIAIHNKAANIANSKANTMLFIIALELVTLLVAGFLLMQNPPILILGF